MGQRRRWLVARSEPGLRAHADASPVVEGLDASFAAWSDQDEDGPGEGGGDVVSVIPHAVDRRAGLRRWAAVTLLLFAWAAVLYVAVLGAVADGFLQMVDLPCEPVCLSVDHANIAKTRDLLHAHGRYAAAYDLYFPRILLIDACVVALVGSATAIRGCEGDVSPVRFSGAAALVLMVGCHIVFWKNINVATLVTE